jgi:hypothetical protein
MASLARIEILQEKIACKLLEIESEEICEEDFKAWVEAMKSEIGEIGDEKRHELKVSNDPIVMKEIVDIIIQILSLSSCDKIKTSENDLGLLASLSKGLNDHYNKQEIVLAHLFHK